MRVQRVSNLPTTGETARASSEQRLASTISKRRPSQRIDWVSKAGKCEGFAVQGPRRQTNFQHMYYADSPRMRIR